MNLHADNSPVFESISAPIRIADSIPLGTVVANVHASDADSPQASGSPTDHIRYELMDSVKTPFLIDSTSGEISVKHDLKKETDSEYRVKFMKNIEKYMNQYLYLLIDCCSGERLVHSSTDSNNDCHHICGSFGDSDARK